MNPEDEIVLCLRTASELRARARVWEARAQALRPTTSSTSIKPAQLVVLETLSIAPVRRWSIADIVASAHLESTTVQRAVYRLRVLGLVLEPTKARSVSRGRRAHLHQISAQGRRALARGTL